MLKGLAFSLTFFLINATQTRLIKKDRPITKLVIGNLVGVVENRVFVAGRQGADHIAKVIVDEVLPIPFA